jgi:hypothetical protein
VFRLDSPSSPHLACALIYVRFLARTCP